MIDKRKNINQGSFNKVLYELSPYLNLGLQIIIPVCLGVWAGIYLDKNNDSSPLWVLVLSFLGIIVGMYIFFKTVLRSNKKK